MGIENHLAECHYYNICFVLEYSCCLSLSFCNLISLVLSCLDIVSSCVALNGLFMMLSNSLSCYSDRLLCCEGSYLDVLSFIGAKNFYLR